jgi:hypothetical protein
LKGSRLQALRLAAAASTVSVLALAGAPAFASGINFYKGSGTGQAINLNVSPNALLTLNLQGVQSAIDQLNAIPGVGQTLTQNLGGTLKNIDEPIQVVVDNAQVGAQADKGQALTTALMDEGIAATSTPVSIKAAALDTELKTLAAALQNIPVGTKAALKEALKPLLVANPTLSSAIDSLNSVLGDVSDALGSPTVSVLQTVNAHIGEEKPGDILTVNGGATLTSLLNPGSTYKLDPFVARAKRDAFANNAVTSLALVPTGKISMPSLKSLQASLTTLQNALIAAENALLKDAGTVGLGTVTGNSTLGTVIKTVNGTVGTVVADGQSVNLATINNVINQISALLSGLVDLDGLQLNDILTNQGDTALATLQRTGNRVSATGHSAVAQISAVKLNAGALSKLVKLVSLPEFNLGSSLVEVDGISADASAVLDGVHTPQYLGSTASGKLATIKVLGKTILGKGGLANLDDYLPAGTQCTIKVPGSMSCQNGKTLDLVAFPDITKGALKGLPALTITLSRGTYIQEATDSTTHSHAGITTLDVAVDIATGDVLAGVVNKASLPVTFRAQPNGPLVHLQMGVAAASVDLTNAPVHNPRPPQTGNEILPLSILAFALVAAGIGLGVRRMRVERVS